MLWAYEELGWGGFWGWDPVRERGLSALAHRDGVPALDHDPGTPRDDEDLERHAHHLTFFLTIFGTFMTRSGIVQSVHAFGQDTQLAWIFTVFMANHAAGELWFVIKRLPELRARATFESWLSREARSPSTTGSCCSRLSSSCSRPCSRTLSDAITGERIHRRAAVLQQVGWSRSGSSCCFLTGVGPLIAWRKASASHLRYQFAFPVAAGTVAVVLCFVAGIQTSWAAVICFGFCAFVSGNHQARSSTAAWSFARRTPALTRCRRCWAW